MFDGKGRTQKPAYFLSAVVFELELSVLELSLVVAPLPGVVSLSAAPALLSGPDDGPEPLPFGEEAPDDFLA